MKCIIAGKEFEMFIGYDVIDDICMLENLLSIILDSGLEFGSTYDSTMKTDWGVEEVLVYLQTKYKKYVCGEVKRREFGLEKF